ncbi:glycosyltransferase family 39 protein [Ottowia sp. GY511]|uniref:ArnT family glycosyltransferase n=1 Tax=Ottowia flava TaxID=2675430 RepID=A0ABW4KRJ5_9BURK|nr:glycosyltransferase family 39 protein [Ottowia sp. GY511]TXK33171.1 glycosyltransferase family 39 protein [Ottowia sp. GY511]
MNSADALSAPTLRAPVAHPLFWLLALCAAHVAVRVAISPALKWDEAEQILWTQQLAWGYGAQPPLYTWLQWGMNQLFGPSVLSLSLLKHGLLALTYAMMYLAGRELLGPRGAWWASASMLLLPPLGWFSVRDQTHTILVTAMTCAAWWLLFRLIKRPRPQDFAWLGLVCAAGVLAKYSYVLVIAVMLVAALSLPEGRRALLSRGWWLAPLVGVLVVAPHAVWLLSHLHEATAGTLHKMQIQPERGLFKGLLSLIDGVAGMLALFALLALWAFRSAWWRKPVLPAVPWAQRLMWRYLALMLLALLGMVLVASVSNFKGRWVLPLLCAVPLAAFAARPELQQHPRGGRYTGAVVTVALILLVAAGLRPWFSGARGDTDELNHPARALGKQLQAQGYDGRSPIIAADHMIGGLLRTRFPQARVAACNADEADVARCVADQVARAQSAGQGWLLVSRADRVEPDWWAKAQAHIGPQTRQSIVLPFRMVRDGTPPAHYDFVWHPSGGTAP